MAGDFTITNAKFRSEIWICTKNWLSKLSFSEKLTNLGITNGNFQILLLFDNDCTTNQNQILKRIFCVNIALQNVTIFIGNLIKDINFFYLCSDANTEFESWLVL